MALSKLLCPECSKVLRPARPVELGQKVRCPSCEAIFIASDTMIKLASAELPATLTIRNSHGVKDWELFLMKP
jgi:DNA-directed RNA polymerase subunit M/transcription elongation factor TFIIS